MLLGCGSGTGGSSTTLDPFFVSIRINSASISPLAVTAGESVDTSWNVTVEGRNNIYGMTVYLSDTQQVTASSIALSQTSADCYLSAGACDSVTVNAVHKIPGNTLSGTYYVIFQAWAYDDDLNTHYTTYVYPDQMTVN